MSEFASTFQFTLVDQYGKIMQMGRAMELPDPGELTLLEENAPSIDHYYANGQWLTKPEKPSEKYIWDWPTQQWVDPRTLDDHKSAKWKEIKRQRDVAEFTTFTYNNMEFDGDLDAQRRLTAYISVSKSSIAAGQPFEAEFTLANNTNVTLTAQDFVGIELAKVQAVAAAFNHASALRAQIDAATTVQEVESITW